MKCVLALGVLLHLCYGAEPNINLYREIITGLDNLNKPRKVNITSQNMIHMPSQEMHEKAPTCEGVFFRELKHLLNNVTVHEDSENILQQLKANMEALGPRRENDQGCQMTRARKVLKPFGAYAAFLRKLIMSKRK